MVKPELRSEIDGLIGDIRNTGVPPPPEDPVPSVKPVHKRRLPLYYIIRTVIMAVALIAAGTAVYSKFSDPKDPNAPQGQITSPAAGTSVPRNFTIVGKTSSIPEGYKVIMVVDVEALRLCWPKKPWIAPNTSFKTHIYEGGPAAQFTLSMYAVDKKYSDSINEWFNAGVLGGMPLIPARYLLDTVILKLQKS